MLESKNTQFSLSPEGQILWQEKVNNPVPGVPVAVLKKGSHPLKPEIEVMDNEITQKHDATELLNHLKLWLKGYLAETIEALTLLEVPMGVAPKEDAVSKIAARVYERLGIIPREEIEDLIAELTTETRTELRAKRIRLGPVLVFMPDLNKPAAVRVRALLLSIYNGYGLPASVPADGIVSVKIDDPDANPDYYRAIGYPLYGGRAVRIDMLDRVISCVYDHAEKGKFQARHEMAEWLGCSIEDLYKVLESMGHVKVYDPAEQNTPEDSATAEGEAEKADATSDTAEADAEQAKAKVENEKPELATFRLKKGKASQSAKGERGKKPFKSKKAKGGDASKGKKHKHKGDKKKNQPRVITAEAKTSDEDSPFAVLQQLKK